MIETSELQSAELALWALEQAALRGDLDKGPGDYLNDIYAAAGRVVDLRRKAGLSPPPP